VVLLRGCGGADLPPHGRLDTRSSLPFERVDYSGVGADSSSSGCSSSRCSSGGCRVRVIRVARALRFVMEQETVLTRARSGALGMVVASACPSRRDKFSIRDAHRVFRESVQGFGSRGVGASVGTFVHKTSISQIFANGIVAVATVETARFDVARMVAHRIAGPVRHAAGSAEGSYADGVVIRIGAVALVLLARIVQAKHVANTVPKPVVLTARRAQRRRCLNIALRVTCTPFPTALVVLAITVSRCGAPRDEIPGLVSLSISGSAGVVDDPAVREGEDASRVGGVPEAELGGKFDRVRAVVGSVLGVALAAFERVLGSDLVSGLLLGDARTSAEPLDALATRVRFASGSVRSSVRPVLCAGTLLLEPLSTNLAVCAVAAVLAARIVVAVRVALPVAEPFGLAMSRASRSRRAFLRAVSELARGVNTGSVDFSGAPVDRSSGVVVVPLVREGARVVCDAEVDEREDACGRFFVRVLDLAAFHVVGVLRFLGS